LRHTKITRGVTEIALVRGFVFPSNHPIQTLWNWARKPFAN